MCGILAIIGKGKDPQLVKDLSKRMSHRGPDESDLYLTEKVIL
jgi:asparagine synthase (glutamine-hydrolysing)